MDKKVKRWVKIMTITKKLWRCHQKPERSFFVFGYQLPLCTRCTGVLIGYLCSFILLIFGFLIPDVICLILIIPLILDGTTQLLFIIMSNNLRRFITGVMFGLGFIQLIANICNLLCALYWQHFWQHYRCIMCKIGVNQYILQPQNHWKYTE